MGLHRCRTLLADAAKGVWSLARPHVYALACDLAAATADDDEAAEVVELVYATPDEMAKRRLAAREFIERVSRPAPIGDAFKAALQREALPVPNFSRGRG